MPAGKGKKTQNGLLMSYPNKSFDDASIKIVLKMWCQGWGIMTWNYGISTPGVLINQKLTISTAFCLRAL